MQRATRAGPLSAHSEDPGDGAILDGDGRDVAGDHGGTAARQPPAAGTAVVVAPRRTSSEANPASGVPRARGSRTW